MDYGRANLGVGSDPSVPPNPDGATLVAIGVFVTQLQALDPVRGEYEFRGHVRSTWCDPRLAFDAREQGGAELVYVGAEAERMLASIFTPSGFPMNRAGSVEITERVLRIAADGSVHSDLNVGVTLETDFFLREFPFDTQRLALVIESVRWTSEEMVVIGDESSTGFSPDFSMQEWVIKGVSGRVDEMPRVRDSRPFSVFTFEVEVKRRAGFYLWKVLLPIFIIVAISWSIFWMTGESVATRTRITATGVLTVVAYQFVIAEGLPRIAYLTILDKLMLVSFSLLAVTVVQSMVVSRFQDDDFPTAMRIDRMSRWVFPLGYAVLVLLVVFSA